VRKIWLIIKREYITRIKTKGFVFGTIAVPVFSIGLMVFSIFLATRLTDRTVRLAIIDNVGGLSSALAAGLNVRLPNGKPEFEVAKPWCSLKAKIRFARNCAPRFEATAWMLIW